LPSSLEQTHLPSERELALLAEKADGLAGADLQHVYAALTGAARARAAEDGLFWLRFVLTRDEADSSCSVKPFPLGLDYLRALWTVLDRSQTVVIAKSRQMLVSWCVASFAVWWARHKANQAVYWQSQQARDAINMVCAPKGAPMGRCQFIESNLPVWMRQALSPLEGRLVYSNGSFIQALPGGAGQIRGNVPSLYIGDEFAFQEEQRGVFTAVAPLIQKGAKAVFISTPNGADNQFAELWHGRPVGTPGV
jgi:phage FluMu gp28-like protein